MRYVLPLLITMICPLMMFFMMRGGHGSHGDPAQTQEGTEVPRAATHTRPPSLDELRSLRDEFETRLDDLDARIDELQRSEIESPHRALART